MHDIQGWRRWERSPTDHDHTKSYIFTSIIVATKIDEVSASSFDHGKDHRTQDIIMKEDRRSRCNFQGCIDFQGWKQFDGITHFFTQQLTSQYT